MNNTNETVDLLQIKIENAKAKLPVETTNAIASVDWKAAILSLRQKKGYNFEQLGDLELETELLLCGLSTPKEYPKELQTRMRLSKAETDELVNDMNALVFEKIKAELIKNSERVKIFADKNKAEVMQSEELAKDIEIKKNANNVDIMESAGVQIVKPDIKELEPNAFNKIDMVEEKSLESREDILKKIQSPDGAKQQAKMPSFLAQKLSNSFQIPTTKTEHSLENISKVSNSPAMPTQTINKDNMNSQESTGTKSGYKVDPYRLSPDE